MNGYVSKNGDCNDSVKAINPNAQEACNGVDDNCNNKVDEGFDVGLPCDAKGIDKGACKGAGTLTCSGDCSLTEPLPDDAFHDAPAKNGSFDWTCNGAIELEPKAYGDDGASRACLTLNPTSGFGACSGGVVQVLAGAVDAEVQSGAICGKLLSLQDVTITCERPVPSAPCSKGTFFSVTTAPPAPVRCR